MYKSFYNINIQLDDFYYIFNTISGTLVKFDEKHYINYLSNNFSFFKDSEINYLTQKLFLKNDDNNTEVKKIEIDVFNNKLNTFYLTIMPNLACNFNCSYCYEKKDNKKLLKTDYLKIFEIIKNIKCKNLVVMWFGGEPTLNYDDIIRFNHLIKNYCLENNINFISKMTTNFFLISSNRFDELLDANIKEFQVTLDGFKNVHDKYRPLVNGKGTFDVLINNLLSVKKNKKDLIIIRVNFDNKNDYGEFIRYLNDNFGDDKRFGFIFRPIENWDKIERDYTCDTELSEYKYTELTSYALKLHMNIIDTYLDDFYGCYSMYPNNMVITNNGEIKKCTVNLNSKDNYYGTLDKFDLSHEWEKFDKCSNCKVFPICEGGKCKYIKTSFDECSKNALNKIKMNLMRIIKNETR